MAYIRHALQSVELPAVTQARASDDYKASATDQWNIGTTSILAHALGLGPSKDNYWSTTVQKGNKVRLWRGAEGRCGAKECGVCSSARG